MRRHGHRKPTFAPKAVCQALAIPSGTLNSWGFHGWFKGLDAEKTTPGKARRFTLDDLFRLAITQYLVGFGIGLEKARPLAHQCVEYMDQAPVSEMHTLIYRNYEMIHLGDLMDDPPPPCALLRLTIYPFEIVKTLRERLGV